MTRKMEDMLQDQHIRYANVSRRSFLKGALAVGGALALAGCGETVTNTVTVTEKNTVTVTDKQTVTVTDKQTVTVTETVTQVEPAAPSVPEINTPEVMFTKKCFIQPEYARCVGCSCCEIVCGLEHCGYASAEYSNIHVHGVSIKGTIIDIPELCQKCTDAPCMAACPPKVAAISQSDNGAYIIDHEKCTLCGLCIDACKEQRAGVLSFNYDETKVVGMCDHCGGEAKCVQYCPENVLSLVPIWAHHEDHYAVPTRELAEKIYQMIYGL